LLLKQLKTGRHTGQIKDGVTSAGGTTNAGVEALERGAFRGATMSAFMKLTKIWVQLELKLLVLNPIMIY